MPPITTNTRSPGTNVQIMNMNRAGGSRGGGGTSASTISTLFNPIKKHLNIKKRLNKHGTNALFRAISAENWELVCTICDTKPYKAEKWHSAVGFFDAHRSSRILPLHQACIFQPTQEAIVHIIQAYPTALESKESGYGRVPLHIACHSNASIESIQILVSHRPSASTEQDNIGRVPLHYALSNGASYDIVKILLDAATQVAGQDGSRMVCSMCDFNGWLPIHVACFMGVSPQVLQEVVWAYPEGVDAPTKKGSTPSCLIKGLAISEERKEVLKAVLMNRVREVVPPPQPPGSTKMDQVVRMSDETCSKGVTLEIDEGETSSLSSIENSTVFSKKPRSMKKLTNQPYNQYLQQHGQHGSLAAVTGSPTNLYPPNAMIRTSSRLSNRRKRPPKPHELPTHSAYDINEEDEEENETGFYANRDVYFPPDNNRRRGEINGGSASANLKGESHQTSTTKSYVSTDDEGTCGAAIFEPITSTAAFC